MKTTVSYEKAVHALSMTRTADRSQTARRVLKEALEFLQEQQADGNPEPVLTVARYYDQFTTGGKYAKHVDDTNASLYQEIVELLSEH